MSNFKGKKWYDKVWVGMALDKEKELVLLCSIGPNREEVAQSTIERAGIDKPVFCMNLLDKDVGQNRKRMENWLLRNGVPSEQLQAIFDGFCDQWKRMGDE